MYVVVFVQQNKYMNWFKAKFKDFLNDKSNFYTYVKVLTHFWINVCKIFHDFSIFGAHSTLQH